jgi:hypothetical protein
MMLLDYCAPRAPAAAAAAAVAAAARARAAAAILLDRRKHIYGIISDQLARAHARRTRNEHGALPSGCDSPLYEGLSA